MGSRWLAWCVPDLAVLISLVTLFYCLFLFDGCRNLFRDSDSGWHIQTGEAILATGSLPRADPYSFSKAGEPWFAWEWGADALMGLAHRIDGLRGVVLGYALAIAACSWLWVRLNWAVGGDFFLACLLAAPMLSTVNLHWLARPHILSWLFMLAALLYLERAGERFRARDAVIAGAGTAVWANLHGSFLFAPLVALLYAAAHLGRPFLWELDRIAEFRRARWYTYAAVFATIGSFLNPYGYELHAHVERYLADSALLARVGEFQSFNFHAEGAWQIVLGVAAAALGAVLALEQKKLAHFLLATALVVVALRSARGLPLVALLALPLANGAILEALRRAEDLEQGLRSFLVRALTYSRRLRAIDAQLSGAALVPLAIFLVCLWMRTPAVAARTGFPPDQFPVAASAAVENLPAEARLLAPDKFGGYLIYRFNGRRKVYFDGRSDFYGAEFMQRYIRLIEARPGWREQVTAMGFTHALLPVNYSLLDGLQHWGWRVLYRDPSAVLLVQEHADAFRVK